MRPYAPDLRIQVVQAYENCEGSMCQLAARFRLSLSGVRDLLTRYRLTGNVTPKPHGGCYPTTWDATRLARVRTVIPPQPATTLQELCDSLRAPAQLTVRPATMSRGLAKLGLARKKTFRAAEQTRPDVQQPRVDFLNTLTLLAPAALVFRDETRSNLAMARDYARAPRGQRVYVTKPVNRGCRGTRLGALGLAGLAAAMTIDGFTDGDVFLAFLHDVLLPQLPPGQIVIMDNLKAHKVAGGAAICAAAEVSLLYLSPYAPALCPLWKSGGRRCRPSRGPRRLVRAKPLSKPLPKRLRRLLHTMPRDGFPRPAIGLCPTENR